MSEGINADVVIPTIGRGSLALLLASLDGPPDHLPHRVIVVDDRSDPALPLAWGDLSAELRERLDVFTSGGRGPAAARNRGWHASRAEWVAFLDDDVIPCRGWLTELGADLDELPVDVAASQGKIRLPPPPDRGGIERARPTSANIAYRRSALLRVGGFDERFPRTRREDADLTRRVRSAGLRIVDGTRTVIRAARPAPVTDVDAPTEAARARALRPRPRAASTAVDVFRRYGARLALVVVVLGALVAGARSVTIVAALAVVAGFAVRRIVPALGRPLDAITGSEVRAPRRTGPPRIARRMVDGVLIGLADDVLDPAAPSEDRDAVARLRDAGVLVARVANATGVGGADPASLGHALHQLGVPAARCALVVDTGAGVDAARATGVRAILVPTAITRRDEVAAAPEVAPTLADAVERMLGDEP